MIIDNVKVYTPDQKFVEGGIILENDRICHVMQMKNQNLLMAIFSEKMFWMEKAPMPFQD